LDLFVSSGEEYKAVVCVSNLVDIVVANLEAPVSRAPAREIE